ncbi:glycosyltransferase [Paenibacillus medicaginis]|uniref:Glycosyltransferase n=1 Tax=Paenibacillus medicaginis TaxID=1470560 RepID=A0ABV5BX46_9BACL
MKKTISLVMIVKNEERTLKRCLESVIQYVDEIIVVDTGSTDQTKDIAAEYQARIFDYKWSNDFAAARNFALEQSTCDWCLVLDADEYISNDCSDAVQTLLSNPFPAVGKVKRIDKFQGKDGINLEQSYITRIFPSYCRYTGKIHEQIVTDLPRITMDVEIQHDGYFQQTKNERNIPLLLEVINQSPEDPYYYYQIAKEYRGLERHEDAFECLKKAYHLISGQEVYAPSLIVNYLYAIMAIGKLEDGIAVIEKEQEFLYDFPDFYFAGALYLLELIMSDPGQYQHLLSHIEQYYMRALEIGDNGKEGSVMGTGSFAAHHNLGVFYEVLGDLEKAKEQYLAAAHYKYEPSIERLSLMAQ